MIVLPETHLAATVTARRVHESMNFCLRLDIGSVRIQTLWFMQRRGRGRGAKGAAQNKRRRQESSEEESISESEEEAEVIRKPPPSRTGRAARNTKRVNYAAIEESGEVLDYLLG